MSTHTKQFPPAKSESKLLKRVGICPIWQHWTKALDAFKTKTFLPLWLSGADGHHNVPVAWAEPDTHLPNVIWERPSGSVPASEHTAGHRGVTHNTVFLNVIRWFLHQALLQVWGEPFFCFFFKHHIIKKTNKISRAHQPEPNITIHLYIHLVVF